jgi:hypothetical protein
LVASLLSSRSFFLHELDGCRALVPYFIYAISTVLTKGREIEAVREACITLLGSIVSLSNYFGQAKFTMKLPKEVQLKLESLLQVESSSKSKALPEIVTYSTVSAKAPCDLTFHR